MGSATDPIVIGIASSLIDPGKDGNVDPLRDDDDEHEEREDDLCRSVEPFLENGFVSEPWRGGVNRFGSGISMWGWESPTS